MQVIHVAAWVRKLAGRGRLRRHAETVVTLKTGFLFDSGPRGYSETDAASHRKGPRGEKVVERPWRGLINV